MTPENCRGQTGTCQCRWSGAHLPQIPARNQSYSVLFCFLQGRRFLHPSDEDLSLGIPTWGSRRLDRYGFGIHRLWFRYRRWAACPATAGRTVRTRSTMVVRLATRRRNRNQGNWAGNGSKRLGRRRLSGPGRRESIGFFRGNTVEPLIIYCKLLIQKN
jgi:hypothetical protein